MAGEDKLREYLKRVTVDLATARRQLAAADARANEPIAVVGLSCRFPEASNVDAYWELLRSGRAAAIGDVPPGRFDHDPRAAGNDLYSPRQGAFLPDVAGFDADFFGFPPREALRMDPQQRLLMELAWEVMEDAGTAPASLAGSRTGVLLGFSDAFQYGQLEADLHGRRVYTDPYMGQGSLASVVAGRLAYHFDLRGPTFSLDTACSSSLVAVHLAVQALRNGECDYALAGGAYLALHPFLYIYSCATSLLSPTDRCHTFDAGADGYMMGEGGGMVMLTRLSDALRDGHRIRAVIRGSAVNQDGRSNGLTAPNRAAQVAVIRQALAAAGATPDEVDYLEAHGSGTRLGDEIELGALNEVFGGRDSRRPLRVGAVKTNIGHTHTAAGIAGFIKTVLVLEHGTVPPNLNLVEPAEAVVESDTVRPATALTPLVAEEGQPLAGVSSFGWSGTNAHVVLAAAPPAPAAADTPPADTPPAHLLPVSAADDTALAAQLTRLAGAVGAVGLADAAYTLQAGRAAHGTRRAVVATDTTDAAGRLAAAAGQPGVRVAGQPRVAFLLPGVGDQYRGLGRALYRAEPVFAAAVDECVAVAQERCGLDLRPVLFADPPAAPAAEPGFFGRPADTGTGDEPLEHAEISHPFLFTVQYALARLLAHRGVSPDLLVGYSLGEYVAACLAGVFSLADALWLVTERARLIEAAPAGRMLAAAADAERVRQVLAGTPAQVDVAALNGPQMTVLSGPPGDVADAADTLLAAGVAARTLRSAHPFHSPLLQPAQDKLAALVASVPRQAPRTAVLSNATGVPLTDDQATDPRYWAEHLCLPVRFADAVRHCLADGIDAYVELGPGQTLGALVRQNLTGDARPTVLGTLPAPWPAQDRPEENVSLLETCGRLWELGVSLDWAAVRHGTGRPTRLPTYPFQRTRYWPQPEEGDRPGTPAPTAQVSGPGLAYTAAWRPDPTRPPADAAAPTGTLVVFADDRIGPELADRAAAAGARVVEVVPGDGFARHGRRVVVDPTDPEHYRQVVTPLAAEGDGPVQVVHLWSLREPAAHPVFATAAELDTALRHAFDSLLLTVQALGAVPASRGVRLLTVTAGAAEIVGGDAVAPDRSLAHGLARGARAEHTDLAWRGVDLPADAPTPTAAAHLVEELSRGPWRHTDPAAEPALIGWRGGRRWLKGWAELPLDEPGPAWDPDGVYLITGGTRGLGMVLARHLVGRGVRRLALVGRTDLRHGSGERVARSRRDVAELEAAGAQVLLLTADAGEPDQLRAALAGAREHYGRLDGVVHCAGLPGGGMAARRTTADARTVLAPKVRAMAPLAELVGPATPVEQRPRLLVLYSSVATVLGGLGESDYCAANTVLDAYGTALAAVADRTQVLTVAWGHWQHDDWPSELTGAALAERTAYRQRYGFTDEAGCDLLDRLVAGVDGRAAGTVVALRQQLPQAVRDWTAINDVTDLLDATPRTAGTNRFPRPPLRVEYVPPRSALETTIAGVWGDYLGIDGVGIHDPFFDLGGNSLVGTAMVTAIERLLDRRIAPAVLFQHPTVAAFTAALDAPAGTGSARPAVGSARGARRRRAGSTRTIGTQQRGQDD